MNEKSLHFRIVAQVIMVTKQKTFLYKKLDNFVSSQITCTSYVFTFIFKRFTDMLNNSIHDKIFKNKKPKRL